MGCLAPFFLLSMRCLASHGLIGLPLLIMCALCCVGEVGKTLDIYLPPAKWYDWYTLQTVTEKGGITVTVDTPIDHLPVSIRFCVSWYTCSLLISN